MVNNGFLNNNTAVMRQLIRTARMLQAEWWQVCGEAWVRGQREMNHINAPDRLNEHVLLVHVGVKTIQYILYHTIEF